MSVLIAGGHRLLSFEIGKVVLRSHMNLIIHATSTHTVKFLEERLQGEVPPDPSPADPKPLFPKRYPFRVDTKELNAVPRSVISNFVEGFNTVVYISQGPSSKGVKGYELDLHNLQRFHYSSMNSRSVTNFIYISSSGAVSHPLPWWNADDRILHELLWDQDQGFQQIKVDSEIFIHKNHQTSTSTPNNDTPEPKLEEIRRMPDRTPKKDFKTMILKPPGMMLLPRSGMSVTLKQPSLDRWKDSSVLTLYLGASEVANCGTELPFVAALSDPESGVKDWYYNKDKHFMENTQLGVLCPIVDNREEVLKKANQMQFVQAPQLPRARLGKANVQSPSKRKADPPKKNPPGIGKALSESSEESGARKPLPSRFLKKALTKKIREEERHNSLVKAIHKSETENEASQSIKDIVLRRDPRELRPDPGMTSDDLLALDGKGGRGKGGQK
ncbi:hypothetical protein ABW19_dt0205690 [Dactylella cylindrospora]|nr:hypothetical protein ABW19_dt0205690 [Dactylella cylindrospora]